MLGKIRRLLLIILLVSSFLALILPNVKANPSTTYYYTNAFDNTYFDWVEFGSSPYLNAQDEPTNIISSIIGANKKKGVWNFPNSGSENSETLNNVYVEIYCRGMEDPDLGYMSLKVYVHDGSSYTYFTISMNNTSYSWRTIDISSKIDNWAKLDACKIYFQCSMLGIMTCQVDCMRLKAISTPVITKSWHTVETWIWTLETRQWTNIETWNFNLLTKQWMNIESWNFNLTTMQWNEIEQWSFNLITKTFHTIETWSFALLTKGWRNIETWSFTLGEESFLILIAFIIIVSGSVSFILLKARKKI